MKENIVNTKTLTFNSALGHTEIDELLGQLEMVLVSNLPEVNTVDATKHSASKFDVTFTVNVPEDADAEVFIEAVLTKEAINMSLFEVGLTGYLL